MFQEILDVRVAVASGKGGTGKTTVAVNLTLSLENAHLFDCDVEEPNVHTLLHPQQIESEPVTVLTPVVDQEKCTLCGECGKFCQFNAIFVGKTKVMVYDEICHSCGGCALVCPEGAIREVERKIGTLNFGLSGEVKLTYGSLNIGEPMAVPLIKAVKTKAKGDGIEILDAPPGTSCTVIETMQECDYVILVTEPTPFGLHDLSMTVNVIDKLDIPYGIIINRAGIGTYETERYLEGKNIPILMEIPFDRRIAELYSKGIPFVTELSEYREIFKQVWRRIEEIVASGK